VMMRRYSGDTLFKQLGLTTIVIVLIGGGGGFAITQSYGEEAETTTSTVRVPINKELQNCPPDGPLVQVSGNALFVFHTTVNPDGTTSLQVTHFSTEGLKVTTESGEPVVVSDVQHTIQNDRISNNVYHTQVRLILVVDGLPNTVGTFVFHTIINEDGTTKHDIAHISIRCVGQG
jgi:hypothetical protein